MKCTDCNVKTVDQVIANFINNKEGICGGTVSIVREFITASESRTESTLMLHGRCIATLIPKKYRKIGDPPLKDAILYIDTQNFHTNLTINRLNKVLHEYGSLDKITIKKGVLYIGNTKWDGTIYKIYIDQKTRQSNLINKYL